LRQDKLTCYPYKSCQSPSSKVSSTVEKSGALVVLLNSCRYTASSLSRSHAFDNGNGSDINVRVHSIATVRRSIWPRHSHMTKLKTSECHLKEVPGRPPDHRHSLLQS
jgi:hypothetical protein